MLTWEEAGKFIEALVIDVCAYETNGESGLELGWEARTYKDGCPYEVEAPTALAAVSLLVDKLKKEGR